MTLGDALLQAATTLDVTVTTAESCTGGMVSAAITDVAGSSAIFQRGFVTYSNQAKQEMLGVSATTLERYGAVSEPVATEMAKGARTASGAHFAVAITGIAGPGGSEHKPEGMVCFAVCQADGLVLAETVQFGALGRANVRAKARDHALTMLLAAIRDAPAA